VSDLYLAHHGIKGQKWGVRRFQNPDGSLTEAGKIRRATGTPTNFIGEGGTLRKNKTLYRVGAEEGDPTVLNRKYFSTNNFDHSRWKYALYDQNMDYVGKVSDLRYKTIKDIRMASNTEVGREFISMMKESDPDTWNNVHVKDIKRALSDYPIKVNREASNNEYWGNVGTATIAAQSKTGQMLVERMLSSGYGGAGDVNGTDVSRDPIIIFDPDSVTTKTSEKIYRSPNDQGYRNYSERYYNSY